MSFLVLLFHAIDATTVTIIYYKGSNVDFIGRSLSQFSDKQIGDIVYGSKMEKLAWYSYISLLYVDHLVSGAKADLQMLVGP